jgi:hypothetical protein
LAPATPSADAKATAEGVPIAVLAGIMGFSPAPLPPGLAFFTNKWAKAPI